MHPFCAAVRTHRWLADDQKIKKNSIRALSSNVLLNQHRKHHHVKSETRKLSQGANENSDKKQGNCLKRGKTWRDWAQKNKTKQNKKKKKKNQFLALELTIFNRPLLHLTHSPVPNTVNEEFLKKNVIYRNISPVKRKVEYSLNTLWVLRMMSCAGWVTCLVLGSWCQRDTNSCARSLSISVPRSLMLVITGAAFRLSREQKMYFRRYSVCWLCKSSRLFSWIKKIKNCCEQRLMF